MVTQLSDETDFAQPLSACDGGERARRTDRIVTHLRLVDLDQLDRHELVNRLIETHVGVARSMAGRYRQRGIDIEDLEQVALVALTKAAQRFDPGAGHDFMSYAAPTIRGEIRRHFRDSGWMVRPPRPIQELQAQVRRGQHELEMRLGRSPRPTELAEHLGVDLPHVVEALAVDGCFAPTSLDTPVGGSTVLGDLLASHDRDLEAAEARILLAPAVQRLAHRDRSILQMRYVEERTQQQIADAFGLTQAQVSRVLTRILRQLRDALAEQSPGAETHRPAWAAS